MRIPLVPKDLPAQLRGMEAVRHAIEEAITSLVGARFECKILRHSHRRARLQLEIVLLPKKSTLILYLPPKNPISS